MNLKFSNKNNFIVVFDFIRMNLTTKIVHSSYSETKYTEIQPKI